MNKAGILKRGSLSTKVLGSIIAGSVFIVLIAAVAGIIMYASAMLHTYQYQSESIARSIAAELSPVEEAALKRVI
ncbi:MAG: hypothetical protein IKF07_06280 [Eubacterium sp.]|nr:hypothetical protein [Eubacterium sp.]